eukprot:2377139-Rhodomonas_salina.1
MSGTDLAYAATRRSLCSRGSSRICLRARYAMSSTAFGPGRYGPTRYAVSGTDHTRVRYSPRVSRAYPAPYAPCCLCAHGTAPPQTQTQTHARHRHTDTHRHTHTHSHTHTNLDTQRDTRHDRASPARARALHALSHVIPRYPA